MLVLSLIAAIAGAILVPVIALHVWYAIGLSRVFATHGGEPWRAWIPLVNEAELFRLGRLDPVRAVLLVVPGVNIYGLVLKATAAHRLGQTAGRGAGTTALAVIFPPVWATILSARPRTDAAPAGEVADESPIVLSETASGPITTIPGTSAAEVATAGRRRSTAVAAEPVAVPVLPGPVDIDDDFEHTSLHPSRRAAAEAAAMDAAESGAAPAGPQVPAAAPGGEPSLTRAPATPIAAAALDTAAGVVLPAASRASAPASASAEVATGSLAETPAPEPDAAPASTVAAPPSPAAAVPPVEAGQRASSSPETSPAVDDTGFDRVGETTDATAAPRTDGDAVPAAPIDELTQTARPRSRRRGEWTLALPDGNQIALTSRTVILGRKPGSGEDAVQYVAVADDTRTMSKQHARLEWTVTGWSITDLDSTNGVTLIHDDGRTERVGVGATAIATSRFRLGDAHIELRPASVA
ncbi:FHA domain-containing protein [Microbacterium sp. BH-3-3-3]|uniref:FHA domain-containing protein n=1 Tax=Microbacterium sp. BH-3-3-3 TaxID=1906742 RepID=UPI00119FA500|nr:FHA domain-containing protein [Microbacterium sp. BH-3-3-3]